MACSCDWGNEPSGFIKCRKIFEICEDLLALLEGLCSTESLSPKSTGTKSDGKAKHVRKDNMETC